MGQLPEVIERGGIPLLDLRDDRAPEDLRIILEGLQDENLRAHQETRRVLNFQVEFGDPDLSESTNGRTSNIRGSWVKVTLDAAGDLNVATACAHNLDVQTDSTNSVSGLNVRWHIYGIRKIGGAPGATDMRLLALYVDGDNITNNSIELRFYTNLTLGGGESVELDLWFIPASP